jgi:hypothetical protein
MNTSLSLKLECACLVVRTLLETFSGQALDFRFPVWKPSTSRHCNFWLVLLGVAMLTVPRLGAQTVPLDLPTNPSFESGSVLAIAVQGDGKILVGGSFASANSTGPANLARLNEDGSLDTSWTVTVNGIVRAICVVGGDVFMGGSFTTVNGEPRNRLAKLSMADGALDMTWNPGLTNVIAANAVVNTLAHVGDHLYVGGVFTSFTGGTRSNLARFSTLNGSLNGWNPGANGAVNAITYDGTYIYAGGAFTTIASAAPNTARNRLVRFLASTGAADAWNPIPSGSFTVNALAVGGGHVYVGGNFTSPKTRLARFTLPGGTLDASWTGSARNTVNTLVANSEHVYVGGAFTTAQSDTCSAAPWIPAGRPAQTIS